MDRRTFIEVAAVFPASVALIPTAALARSSSLRDAWRILDAETVNIKTGASAESGR